MFKRKPMDSLMSSADGNGAYKDAPVPIQDMGGGYWSIKAGNGMLCYVNTRFPTHESPLFRRNEFGQYVLLEGRAGGHMRYCDV